MQNFESYIPFFIFISFILFSFFSFSDPFIFLIYCFLSFFSGYGICNAAGNIAGVIGIFLFLYAQQPQRNQTTFSYPCNRAKYPTDFGPTYGKIPH